MSDISSKTMFDRKNCFSKVYKELLQNGETPLDNQKTARAVAAKLSKTKKSMIVESSKPCFLFWGVNSICFLDQLHNHKNLVDKSIEYLESISLSETTKGAFSGGYMQMPDLANTFASVCVVVAINNTETRNRVLNKRKIKEFLMRMKNEDGSFSMHENGESDCRSIYSAVATASMLNILSPELTKNVVDFIENCQTYEGGFGAVPGTEAHGGYSFCAFATLCILKKTTKFDKNRFLKWVVSKQVPLLGGFQGRTNKLVDSCYSFWVGSLLVLYKSNFDEENLIDQILLDKRALKSYLSCCQNEKGLFSDKPGIRADLNHTFFSICGWKICADRTGKPNDELDCALCVKKENLPLF